MLGKVSKVCFAIIVACLVGCFGAAPIKPVAGPEYAVAYGNISLPGNKVITNVILYKVGEVYAPPFKSPPTSHTYNNGNFFFENLKPGKYFLMGFMSGRDAFYFNYQGMKEEEFIKKAAVEIKPGSATYLGSYQVTGIERNTFKSDTFDIKRSRLPARKTILNQLTKVTKGTGWDKRFSKAMK